MAGLTLTSISPEDVSEEGGVILEITGDFSEHLGQAFNAYIGVTGDATDEPALSGTPGAPTTIYPVSASLLRVFTPLLGTGVLSVFVTKADLSVDGVLSGVLTVHKRDFKTSVYSHRKAWAPIMLTGPRSIDEEEPV